MSDDNHGIIILMGWRKIRGKDVFRAVVEFPNGPPHIPVGVVWDRRPVDIIERKTQSEGTGK